MQKIQEIGVFSLAKIMAIIYGAFGFLIGIFVIVSNVLGFEASGEGAQFQAVGYASIVIFPVVYAVIGFLSGVSTGFFFNRAAKWIGPLEVKIVQS